MFRRYEIDTRKAPMTNDFPGRFLVHRQEGCINCGACADACVYGVHLKDEGDPRLMATPSSLLCVGCFRCVMECPVGVLDIEVHPEFKAFGDGYIRPRIVEGIWREAEDGRIPVSGAGYRGPFVQPGFDAMWTDMSEIVRPTRDGIHGREYISTGVDIGRKPPFLDPEDGVKSHPILEIPIPFLFNPPGGIGRGLEPVVARAATELGTYAIVPATVASGLLQENIIPRIRREEELEASVLEAVQAVEVDGSDLGVFHRLKEQRRDLVVFLRLPLNLDRREEYLEMVRDGVDVLHLHADPHGREIGAQKPRFIAQVLRDLDQFLVEEGVRDEVTILASGGVVASEHVPKAILCGADAVVLDSTYLIALGWNGSPDGGLPGVVDASWAVQRIKNWANACRDQLLEIMGAMGMRDVRRLAGEVGRAMFHEDLEAEFKALFQGGARDG